MKVVLCLWDKKAEQYMTPFFVPAMGVAFRHLQDEIARGGEGNLVSSHPGDFVLVHLGHFEDDSGVLTCHPPKHVVEVSDLVAKT